MVPKLNNVHKCRFCGRHYDKADLTRQLGNFSEVISGGFCSAQCYTKHKQNKDNTIVPFNSDDAEIKQRIIIAAKLKRLHIVLTKSNRNPAALIKYLNNVKERFQLTGGGLMPSEIKKLNKIAKAFNVNGKLPLTTSSQGDNDF